MCSRKSTSNSNGHARHRGETMKRHEVHTFEKLTAQLRSLYQEMSALAKKSPNDAINHFKLEFVNRVLANCNEFLGQNYRPFSEFEVFSSDAIPSNSDVTFILAQYIECAENFRTDNIFCKYSLWYWNIDDADPENVEKLVQTTTPKKLAGK